MAVFNGKNVTAAPPRTELWALLYAQVKQADNQDFRNILLGDKPLDWRVQVDLDRQSNWLLQYTDQERQLLKAITVKTWSDDLNFAKFGHIFKLTDFTSVDKDATKYGTTVWSNDEISQLLELYGLPPDSPLSVLVVEMLPTITNIYEAVPGLGDAAVNGKLRQNLQMSGVPEPAAAGRQLDQISSLRNFQPQPDPLSDELGQHRILRTSPLTEVPFVC